MIKNIVLTLSVLLYFGLSYGQPLTTTLGVEATDLADRLQGEGVTILNPELYCHWTSQGLYEDDTDILGIGDGIVLSIANLLYLVDDNTEFPVPPVSVISSNPPNLIDTLYHRPLLDSWEMECLAPAFTCALTMDVVPQYHELAFDYVLADGLLDSILPAPEDDYGSSVSWIVPTETGGVSHPCICYPYTDFITAMVSGGSLEDTVNLAVYPEDRGKGNDPVNRYTLRMTTEMFADMCEYEEGADGLFWDGPYLDYCRYNQEGGSIEEPGLRVRGMTVPMQASVSLNPCDTYRLVLSVSMLRYGSGSFNANLGRAVYFISNLHSSGDSCGTTGIEDLKHTLGLSINPNPFSEQLRLSISQEYTNRALAISVSDITGRNFLMTDGNVTVLNQKLDALSSALNPGMYFISVQDRKSNHRGVFKVVKE